MLGPALQLQAAGPIAQIALLTTDQTMEAMGWGEGDRETLKAGSEEAGRSLPWPPQLGRVLHGGEWRGGEAGDASSALLCLRPAPPPSAEEARLQLQAPGPCFVASPGLGEEALALCSAGGSLEEEELCDLETRLGSQQGEPTVSPGPATWLSAQGTRLGDLLGHT